MGPKRKARTARLAAIVALALITLALSISALFAQSSLWPTLTGIITGLTALIAVLAVTVAWPRAAERPGQEVEALKEEYLRRWITLERLMRGKLAESTNDESYTTAPLSTILEMYSQVLGNSGEKTSALLSNLRLRNQIVHASSEGISSEELSHAISELNAFLDNVDTERPPAPANVLHDADTVSNRDDEAASRLLNRGVASQQQGDLDAARAAFQRAIDTGNPNITPLALVLLGIASQQQGDPAAARAAFQRAVDTGSRDFAPPALLSLGILLDQQGDIDAARAAFQQAIKTGDSEVSDVASELLRNVKRGYSRPKESL